MKKLLFINGCIRDGESRTLKLAQAFTKHFSETHPEFEMETADIDSLGLLPLTKKTLDERNAALDDFSGAQFETARQFKAADMLLIATPFWEGTFPAALHVYIEHICVSGLTFSLDETGYVGLCKAEKAVFITTRGGIYEHGTAACDEHARAFLKTVLSMLGVHEMHTVAAEGLDIFGAPVEETLEKAKAELISLAKRI